MKLRKILLLSLGMALCAAGGVGVAVAEITRQQAHNDGSSSFDKVINLYWGHESSTASFNPVEDLVINVPQYRYLEVSPKSSASVSGQVVVTFELSLDSEVEGGSINGLTVKVYETSETKNDSNIAAAISGVTPDLTLTGTSAGTTQSGDVSFNVSPGETAKHYAIAVNYDGSNLDGGVIAGNVDISQEFNPAA